MLAVVHSYFIVFVWQFELVNRSHVQPQTTSHWIWLNTMFTLVWPQSEMRSLVSCQVTLPWKRLLAMVTAEWLHITVYNFVLIEVCRTSERLATDLTSVRLQSNVSVHVLFKRGFRTKKFTTVFTFVFYLFLTRAMMLFMHFQMMWRSVLFATNVTDNFRWIDIVDVHMDN